MHPLVKNTIKFFLFLAVAAFLFWLVYRSSLCYGDCQSRQPGPAVAVADRIYGV